MLLFTLLGKRLNTSQETGEGWRRMHYLNQHYNILAHCLDLLVYVTKVISTIFSHLIPKMRENIVIF